MEKIIIFYNVAIVITLLRVKMKIYEEIPIEEETLNMLNLIMEQKELENHDAVINYLFGLYFLDRARGFG